MHFNLICELVRYIRNNNVREEITKNNMHVWRNIHSKWYYQHFVKYKCDFSLTLCNFFLLIPFHIVVLLLNTPIRKIIRQSGISKLE